MAHPCPECGTEVRRIPGQRGGKKHFCSEACKTAFQSRAAKEGRAIIAIAKAWRMARSRPNDKDIGKDAFAELCRVLDDFNAQDRKAGRAPATDYARILLGDGRLYMDRKRG